MLRPLLLLLVLLNLVFYVWSSGRLAGFGWAPVQQSEPQRSAQAEAETLHILSPSELEALRQSVASESASAPKLTPASAPVASQCLQAGWFTPDQAGALRLSLGAGMPPGSWQFEAGIEPARWIIYMGKYDNPQALAKKRAELRQLNIAIQALDNPQLEPGLSLGSFETKASAEADLARINKHGVKTAKVVLAQAERSSQRLKLPAVDTALQARLEALKLPLAGKALIACR